MSESTFNTYKVKKVQQNVWTSIAPASAWLGIVPQINYSILSYNITEGQNAWSVDVRIKFKLRNIESATTETLAEAIKHGYWFWFGIPDDANFEKETDTEWTPIVANPTFTEIDGNNDVYGSGTIPTQDYDKYQSEEHTIVISETFSIFDYFTKERCRKIRLFCTYDAVHNTDYQYIVEVKSNNQIDFTDAFYDRTNSYALLDPTIRNDVKLGDTYIAGTKIETYRQYIVSPKNKDIQEKSKTCQTVVFSTTDPSHIKDPEIYSKTKINDVYSYADNLHETATVNQPVKVSLHLPESKLSNNREKIIGEITADRTGDTEYKINFEKKDTNVWINSIPKFTVEYSSNTTFNFKITDSDYDQYDRIAIGAANHRLAIKYKIDNKSTDWVTLWTQTQKYGIKTLSISQSISGYSPYDDTIRFKVTDQLEESTEIVVTPPLKKGISFSNLVIRGQSVSASKSVIIAPLNKEWDSEITEVDKNTHATISFSGIGSGYTCNIQGNLLGGGYIKINNNYTTATASSTNIKLSLYDGTHTTEDQKVKKYKSDGTLVGFLTEGDVITSWKVTATKAGGTTYTSTYNATVVINQGCSIINCSGKRDKNNYTFKFNLNNPDYSYQGWTDNGLGPGSDVLSHTHNFKLHIAYAKKDSDKWDEFYTEIISSNSETISVTVDETLSDVRPSTHNFRAWVTDGLSGHAITYTQIDIKSKYEIWVYTGSKWTEADAVFIYNGTKWIEADEVYVYNGSTWKQ